MSKLIEFTADVYSDGRRLYAAGERHPASPQTARWVRRGAAREWTPPAPQAEAPARSRPRRPEVPTPGLPLGGEG
jgi:hypothetical protein